jgi:hypothetical protein
MQLSALRRGWQAVGIVAVAMVLIASFGAQPTAAADAFAPNQATLPVVPPDEAIVLFGPESEGTGQFVAMDGGASNWKAEDGVLEVTRSPGHANHAVSSIHFRDADIHAEFKTVEQAKGNSGLYIHGHFEMQVLNSFGVEDFTIEDEGSLYRFAPPLVNASRPVGEWQVYDIRFRAPRHDADGNVTEPGSITAWLNGQLVQDGVTFEKPRSPYIPYRHGVTDYLRGVEKSLKATGAGPLFLQDHGAPVQFRNVWIRPLDDAAGEYTPAG